MNKKQLLVVDDGKALLDVLAGFLSSHGYKVSTAVNGHVNVN
jgi:CheY-like chemotaxis protein